MKQLSRFLFLTIILSITSIMHSQPAKTNSEKVSGKNTSTSEITEFTLDNGLQVILKPMNRTPIVSTFLFYKVGSSYESEDYYGASHFLEHLMFKGTNKYKKGEIDKITQLNGGENNAFTSSDYTVYHFQFPKKNWETALEIEADRMRNCLFDAKEFNTEREVVIEELNENIDDPWSDLFMKTNHLIYGENHGYGHPILGLEDVLRKLTPEKIRSFYNNFYQPDNAVLVVAGDIDLADAKEKINKHFNKITKRDEKMDQSFNKIFETPVTPEFGTHNVDKDTNIIRLTMSFATVPKTHKDYPALLILDSIMTNGESSRMIKSILIDKKLADDFGSWSYSRALTGEFTFWAELGLDRDYTLIFDEINNQISAIKTNLPSKYEVDKAKNQTLAHLVFSGQKTHVIAENLGYNKLLYNDALYQKKFIESIKNVTPSDIQRVVKTYFSKDKTVITVMKPENDEELEIDTFKANGFEIQSFQLENGLKVKLVEDHNAEMIALDLGFNLGSMFEPADKVGVYKLMSKMLLQGTEKLSANQISEKISFWGAKVTTRGDGIEASILRQNFDDFTKLLADVVTSSVFPEEKLELKKDLEINTLKSLLDDPDEVAYREFLKLVYPKNHPYAFIETIEGFEKITRNDLIEYYKKVYIPNNATLYVVGDINAKDLSKLIKNSFENWKKGEVPELKIPEVQLQKDDRTKYIKKPDTTQAAAYIGHLGIKRSNPDYYSLVVLDNILGTGAGFTDRLTSDLRDTRGYAYTVWMVIGGGSRYDYGRLIGGIQTSKENIINAVAGIIEHMNKIQETNVTDAEIKGAKEYLVGSFPAKYESFEELVRMLRRIDTYNLGYEYFAQYSKNIEKVTKADVLRVAKKYLHPDTLTLSICGDIDEDVDYLAKAREKLASEKEKENDK